jgi:hypothetical protein
MSLEHYHSANPLGNSFDPRSLLILCVSSVNLFFSNEIQCDRLACWIVSNSAGVRFLLLAVVSYLRYCCYNIVSCRPVARQRPRNRYTTAFSKWWPVNSNRRVVFSAQSMPMAVNATMEYVMPPLSNNCTAREEWCFLRGPYQNVIDRMVSDELSRSFMREVVGGLEDRWGPVVVSCCC